MTGYADREPVKTEVLPVSRGDILHIWEAVRGYLQGATDRSHGRMTIDDVLLELLTGDSVLWVIFNTDDMYDIYGAATTRIVQYPNAKVVCGDFCGGREVMIWSKELEDTIIAYAKHVGARQVELYGRRGWARAFGPGWDTSVVMMTKRI